MVLGAEMVEVNSYHHQAAREIGRGLEIVAVAEDGVIEALTGTGDSRIWAVQWHPERMGDQVAGDGLLRAFIDQCKKRRIADLK